VGLETQARTPRLWTGDDGGHGLPRPTSLGGPGGRAGAGGLGRAAGSAQSDRIVLFFSNLFLMPEKIPEIAEIVLKAQKILRKSQKFQENS
jgi:hypothetical protein